VAHRGAKNGSLRAPESLAWMKTAGSGAGPFVHTADLAKTGLTNCKVGRENCLSVGQVTTYSVPQYPMDNGKESEGAAKHKTPGERVRKLMTKLGVPETHTPDLTQRNFAVVELQRDDGTIEYVTDSSFPSRSGVTGLHSERHIADWVDDVNKANEGTRRNYTITALYTEREPCGDKKGGLGSSNCSNLLGERLAGAPVYYSTIYRADPADQQRSELTRELQKQRRAELGLDPRAALPDDEKKKITAQVKQQFPVTANEKARDREMVRHVRKVEALWKGIAPQLR
jgi:hypothetical protein